MKGMVKSIGNDREPEESARRGLSVRLGIRTKLGLVLFGIIALTLLASGVWDVHWIKDRGMKELEHTAEMTSKRLAGGLALPLWEMEKQKIEDIVNSEMTEEALFAVIIKGSDGKSTVLGKKRDKDQKIISSDQDLGTDLIAAKTDILRSKGANTAGEKIGTVEVYLTDNFLKREVRDKAIEIALKGLCSLLIIVSFLYLFLSRLILTPILVITAHLRENSDDLTRRIEIDTRDEIGELAEAFNEMTSQLCWTLGRVTDISQTLSEGASKQAESLQEASASLEQMASSTKQNAESSAHANNLIQQAKDMVTTANESMSMLTVSMQHITAASEETQKIVRTIDEIAFQTNLLALNAAVEAARAGEAGAGFAVVAEEVRNLAMRAAEAARNTARLIEGTVKKIREGDQLVLKTSEAFEKVGAITLEAGEHMRAVTVASNEAASGVELSTSTIASMSEITNQNATEAQELASMVGKFEIGVLCEADLLPVPRAPGTFLNA